MKKVVKYVMLDILNSKTIIIYTVLLFCFSMGLFLMEDVVEKSLTSILTLNLILVPLASIIFSTIYVYNSAEFIELLLGQPIRRTTLWLSIFGGLALALMLAFFIGCGIPIFIFAFNTTGIMLLITGLFLSLIFVSIALLTSVYIKDKAKGIGASLMLWMYFSILFDGFVLFLLFQLLDYPLENLIVALSVLNPIDLARIISLVNMDISALMGATSAVFKKSFSGVTGSAISFFALTLWAVVPLYFSVRKFKNKDL